MHTIVLDLQ